MQVMGENIDLKLQLLEESTENFSDKYKVGTGGYGNVYRAMIKGKEIALKKLHPINTVDDKAFDNEFRSLSMVCHQNIIRLVGYCYESRETFVRHEGELVRAKQTERVLCFEFMQGGSLDKHIKDESCDLDWSTCYKIIRETCDGLNHLHTAYGRPIFHLDLKPHNILLDKDTTVKIADLGLSRLVTTSETHKTETQKGTIGYMPPEYAKGGHISKKFDVFSLGVIIIKIMAGNKDYFRHYHMDKNEFIELVTKKCKEKPQGTSKQHSSQEIDILRMKTCVEIALRCVEEDRSKRPLIREIVAELKQLEDKIEEMSLSHDGSRDVVGQRSSDSNVLAVDPSLELRFLFEPRKDISCCLQLTNKTDGFVAYNIKINKSKYRTKPSKGIMPPCSKCYISVTLRAQEEAPLNMQCHDMFLVQNVNVREGLTADEITQDLFEKAMTKKVVDVVNLPIVYVAALDH